MTAPTGPRLPGGGTPHPNPPRIGSLFSGYGGLDMAVDQVLGGQVAWVCDIDPGACAVLAHHHPDVPNLGDVSGIDWTAVEPVDVLTGGFPCQDVSLAGRRAGLVDGTRSGLWTQMARAIDALRPHLVVIENVRGLCSAPAAGDLEPCPWCVGDDEGVPLRALGAVLGDLADLGYDASWCGLRAADVGAPHGRFRVFIVATAADSGHGVEPERSRAARREVGQRQAVGGELGRDRHQPAFDADCAGREGTEPAQRPNVPARRLAAHSDGVGCERAGSARDGGSGPAHHGVAVADSTSAGWGQSRGVAPGPAQGVAAEEGRAAGRSGGAPAGSWREYGAAIARWENVLGRPAPNPTESGRRGQPVLSPAFVEWLMGLPAGHVTSVPGLSRNQQLRLLGNGVVPQQGAAALAYLLTHLSAAAA